MHHFEGVSSVTLAVSPLYSEIKFITMVMFLFGSILLQPYK